MTTKKQLIYRNKQVEGSNVTIDTFTLSIFRLMLVEEGDRQFPQFSKGHGIVRDKLDKTINYNERYAAPICSLTKDEKQQ